MIEKEKLDSWYQDRSGDPIEDEIIEPICIGCGLRGMECRCDEEYEQAQDYKNNF